MPPTSVTLGYVPAELTVELSRRSNFTGKMRTPDGSAWPDGTVVNLVLTAGDNTVTWPATVDADAISWDVPKTTVVAFADLAAGEPAAAVVTYTNGGDTDLLWMTGWVQWID